jgi:hypothetical protein
MLVRNDAAQDAAIKTLTARIPRPLPASLAPESPATIYA